MWTKNLQKSKLIGLKTLRKIFKFISSQGNKAMNIDLWGKKLKKQKQASVANRDARETGF